MSSPNTNFLVEVKEELEEHNIVNDIKVENDASYECDDESLKPDTVKVGSFNDVPGIFQCKSECHNLTNIMEVETEKLLFLEDKLCMSTNDTKPYQLAMVKVEGEPSTKLEPNYYKVEQVISWDHGRSSSSNMEKDLKIEDAGPSTSCQVKCEEVDLSEIKMDEDDHSSNKIPAVEDQESDERHLASEESQFVCSICGCTLNDVLDFQKHHHAHLLQGICTVCGTKFNNKKSLDGHIVMHHCDNDEMMDCVTHDTYRCKHCKYVTIWTPNLAVHMKMHSETVDCIVCRQVQTSKELLETHILDHHFIKNEVMKNVTHKILRCKYCTFVTVCKINLSRHMKIHLLGCTVCDKKFCDIKSLDGHIVGNHFNNEEMMRSITSDIYRCKHCEYVTVCRDRFHRHMYSHAVVNSLS